MYKKFENKCTLFLLHFCLEKVKIAKRREKKRIFANSILNIYSKFKNEMNMSTVCIQEHVHILM